MGSVYRVLKRDDLILAGLLIVALVAVTPAAAMEWTIQTVDDVGDVGEFTSLALDSNGYPHISYHNSTTMKYAAWNGSEWHNQTVDSVGNVGEYTSLALNISGYPCISYRDATNNILKYASWNGSFWNTETVDNAWGAGWYTSLSLNSSDYPCVSYHNTTVLKYASWNGSSWVIQTVDSSANIVGAHSSLALKGGDYPCISYYYGTNGDLKYAAWNGTAWTLQIVDSVGDVGKYTSLALDSSGNPRISYYENINKDLKYAAWSGTAWSTQTIDSIGDVGSDTSLALDNTGNPGVSYYDTTNGDLKYAAWSGTAWSTQVVDSTGNVGKYTSLTLDSSGSPCISYYDTSNWNLKYANGAIINAGFTAAPTSGNSPLVVSFSDTSTGAPIAWTWYFGDGWVSTSQNPVHSYTSDGTYTVYLTSRDIFTSNTTVQVGYINVTDSSSPAVVSGFIGSPISGTAPLTVIFNDTSTNNPTSWNWNFGSWSVTDGGVSTAQNSSHIYQSAGTYTVTLNAQNANGGDTYTRAGYINVTDSSSPAVVSGFIGSPISGTAPLTVIFNDTSTNNPTSWNWNFGSWSVTDGGVSTAQNSSHIYQNAGTYTVTLNAQNANGGDTYTRAGYINVTDSSSPAVVSGFTGSLTSGNAPLTVTFTDTSVNSPTSWNWNFGSWSATDSGVSNARNPSHTYQSAGTFTVTLNAQNANGGDMYTRPGYITVTDSDSFAVVSGFTGAPTNGTAPLTVTFTDTSDNTPTCWNWNFGSWNSTDGGVSTLRNPSHTYQSAGTFTVTLNAQNENGGDTFTRSGYITVTDSSSPAVVSGFIGSPVNGTAPLTVTFNDTSDNTPTCWNWNFGSWNSTDGGVSTLRNPSHTYQSAGTFTVTLNAQNENGGDTFTRSGYITVTDSISSAVVSGFTGAPTNGTAPLTVTFTDTSDNTPTSWNWSFGDGSLVNATVKNPVHTYANIGTYAVTLNATNSAGSDSITRTNYVTVTSSINTSKIAVFRNGMVYIGGSNTDGGLPVNAFNYGISADKPITGKWIGNAIDTIGIFREGKFYLRNSNNGGVANTTFHYGQTGDVPVSGHWSGDGNDTVGIFRSGTFFLASSNTPGGGTVNAFNFGQNGDVPVAGDWDGDGKTEVGIFRNGTFFLASSNTPGGGTVNAFNFGQAGDVPVAGDWNGDGKTEVGIFRNGMVYLASSSGSLNNYFSYGMTDDLPFGGHFS
jgi:PKD repeat protein